MKRMDTRSVHVGGIEIGHQNKVIIQTMCNTKTKDIFATVEQILALEQLGCEIVRLAVVDEEDAQAIEKIKKKVHIPLVADIHFDYRLALKAIAAGVDKIRLNPGNIGSKDNVMIVVNACKVRGIPIRIGINGGSLEKELLEKYGKPCAEAMIESAKRHVAILEELNFYDILLSFKSSDPLLCLEVYRLASTTFPYPLHLGVTEAGTLIGSAVKSAFALGTLLNEGIGDTIRISVNGDPQIEMKVVKQLLSINHLYDHYPNLIACPSCGRTSWEMQPIVDEIEDFLQKVSCRLDVAIMGCAVNGPGEARHADIAIAGGKNEALLIKKGEIIEKISIDQIVDRLKKEIIAFAETQNAVK